MNKVVARGVLRGDGKIIHNSPKFFMRDLRKMEPGQVRTTVERIRGTRSQNQNRYYWGSVLVDIIEGLEAKNGHPIDRDELHTYLKWMLLPHKKIQVGDIEIEAVADTHTMTTDQFGEYLELVIAHAATEWGVEVKEADPIYDLK